MELFLFMPAASLEASLLALVFGMMIGSFLNVVIHRFPIIWQRDIDNFIAEETGKEPPHTTTYNLVTPGSACPHCGHKITPFENIPVISYLALRGKCRGCKAPISARYPALEMLTGVLSALLIWHFGSGIYGLASLGFLYLLIPIFLIDAQTKQIPDELNYMLLWLGLLINVQTTICPLPMAVVGAFVGYCFLYLINFLSELILKKQGIGNGDFKLFAALGAWFGWMALPQIILLSSLAGIVGTIIGKVFGKNAEGGKIPFWPIFSNCRFGELSLE